MQRHCGKNSGLSLMELSVVLVIVGLIVGSVLVGQDLVTQSAIRAQISQIQKFDTAAQAFSVKYGYLPGDIPDPYASRFGFQARGQYTGEGDGNNIIQGCYANGYGDSSGIYQALGETVMFWVDLSTANMIDGVFNSATPAGTPISSNIYYAPYLTPYLPQAKIGQGNYIAVWSGGVSGNDATNYYGLTGATYISGGLGGGPALTVQQAYNIDKKIDDGLPQSGIVQATAVTTGGWVGANPGTSTGGTPSTCYDNGSGGTSAPMQYSMEINKGAYMNCMISFQFQMQ